MFKTVLAIALLLIVKVLATPMYGRLSTISENMHRREAVQEAACAVQGGMCLEPNECNPSDIVRVADLCPLQSHLGVVCCYYH